MKLAELIDLFGASRRNLGAIHVYPALAAKALLRQANEEGVSVLGFDAFRLVGDRVEPDLALSMDFSSSRWRCDDPYPVAMETIEKAGALGLFIEIVWE